MELTTLLSRDRFDWMQSPLRRRDHAVMLVRVAPSLPAGADTERQDATPTNLVIVLDRSGSMGGAPIEHAKRALVEVVGRLGPHDSFGLVTFDQDVDVVVPAGPVSDRASIVRAITAVEPRGSTDLGAGLVRGLQEALRLDSPHGVRVLLVSDGHANRGVVDPDVLGGHVGELLGRRVTTSTLGMGLDFDETLLSRIAQAGSGNEHFAEQADAAAGAIADECGDLLAQRFLSCRLVLTPASGVAAVDVVNEATVIEVPHGIEIDLGGMQVGETRSLVLELTPHTATRPGRRKIGKVELRYLLADDLSEHVHSTTVWTQVMRRDDREGRIDRDAVTEWYLQRVLRRKRRAMRALALGDLPGTLAALDRVRDLATHAADKVVRSRRPELLAEADQAAQLRADLPQADAMTRSRTSKQTSSDLARRSRRQQ